jgi:hypothetical protein
MISLTKQNFPKMKIKYSRGSILWFGISYFKRLAFSNIYLFLVNSKWDSTSSSRLSLVKLAVNFNKLRCISDIEKNTKDQSAGQVV